jgi:hypothetical protein
MGDATAGVKEHQLGAAILSSGWALVSSAYGRLGLWPRHELPGGNSPPTAATGPVHEKTQCVKWH